MTNQNTPDRTRLLASGLLVVTFAVGALAGAAGDRLLTAEPKAEVAPVTKADSTRSERERDRNRGRRGSILLDPKVLEELGTTVEQRQKINTVLERRDQEAKRIFNEMQPRLDAMMQQTRDELRAQLTPAQLTRLDEIINERRARWEKNRSNGNQSKSPMDSAKKHPESERDHTPRI